MRRVAACALILCALCVGCENTDFYHQKTTDWFAPHAKPEVIPAGVDKVPLTSDDPMKIK